MILFSFRPSVRTQYLDANVLELRKHRTDKPVLGRISCQRACVNNERGDHGEEWRQNDDNNSLQ